MRMQLSLKRWIANVEVAYKISIFIQIHFLVELRLTFSCHEYLIVESFLYQLVETILHSHFTILIFHEF